MTPTAGAVQALAPANPPSADALAEALASEKRLFDELIAIMHRQRSAVSADDRQLVHDTVFATHRVLATLSEARRRRQALNRMLGEREDLSLDALDEVFGARMTDLLRTARGELHGSARALAREVSVNRRLLRHAFASAE
jgi:FlgN protein.